MRRAHPLRSAIHGPFCLTWLTGAGLVAVALLLTGPNVAAQSAEPPTQPTITAAPKISGIPRVGQTLTADAGAWTPPTATPTYQWLRCNAEGQLDSCQPIGAGTTEPAPYTVVEGDVEHALRIRLTVSSGNAAVWTESDATAPVPRAPANTKLPTVSGTAREGELLTAAKGEWIGTPPLSYDYLWQRCGPSGRPCTAIPGAMSTGYVLSSADVGLTVRVRVTASNAAGESAADSAPTSIVAPSALANLDRPAIVGVAEVGRSLTALPGRWTPSGGIEFLYRWLRCKADRSECDAIPGADSRTYEVRLTDVGSRLRVRVTAIADAGASTVESDLTPVVPAPPGAQDFTQGSTSPANPDTSPTAAALMRPFPRVRLKGFYTSAGAVLQLVTIKGPAGTRIRLVCRGRSCPFRRRTLRGNPRVRLRSLERFHPAGTRIEVRVTSAGLIGKFTRIIIRAGRPPARRDRCLMPGSARPVQCPVLSD
jgi:hypothetical protein